MIGQSSSPIVPRNVAETVAVTKNSTKLTEPIVYRGVVPWPSRVEVTIDPQPPPPIASRKPPPRPSGAIQRGGSAAAGLPQDPGAYQQEVGADEGGDRVAREGRQQVGAGGSAQHARERQVPDERPVDVPEAPVREARDAGGEDLGR